MRCALPDGTKWKNRNALVQALSAALFWYSAPARIRRVAPPLLLSKDQAESVLRVFDEALTKVTSTPIRRAGQ